MKPGNGFLNRPYVQPSPGEATERANVTVVFLHMPAKPLRPRTVLPAGVHVRCEQIGVEAYRQLYQEVGSPWLWWLRHMMSDKALAKHLGRNTIEVHQLLVDGEVAGFFELDASYLPVVNLNYFGLLPRFVGRGLGWSLLNYAVDTAFEDASPTRRMSVNTCNADHPRALPNYLAAGFCEYRRAEETWDIPVRLGFKIPDHLKG